MRFLLVLFFVYSLCRTPYAFYTDIPASTSPVPTLSHTYHYLGQGAQVYAFVSHDGSHVLKLFKARHQKKFKFRRLFPTKAQRAISRNKWKTKFQESCKRYELALEHLQEETGLISLHFEKSSGPLFVVIDGRKFDLSGIPFILQKRATLIPDYPDRSLAKAALKELFRIRATKGFTDPRQTLSVNYGILDGKAIQLDVGKLEPLTGSIEEEVEKIHQKVERWFND